MQCVIYLQLNMAIIIQVQAAMVDWKIDLNNWYAQGVPKHCQTLSLSLFVCVTRIPSEHLHNYAR